MKLTTTNEIWYYRFMSSVKGSAESEYGIFDTATSYNLDSEKMAVLYDAHSEIQEFIDTEAEDLVDYLKDCSNSILSRALISARFGDIEIINDRLCHIVEIESNRELEKIELQDIQTWINGQLSDGWGEGTSQRTAYEERYEWVYSSFDPDNMQVEQCEDIAYICYTLDFSRSVATLYTQGTRECEVEVGEIVLNLERRGLPKVQIIEFKDFQNLEQFCHLNNCTSFIDFFNDRQISELSTIYLAAENDNLDDSPIMYASLGHTPEFHVDRLGGHDIYNSYYQMVYEILGTKFFKELGFLNK